MKPDIISDKKLWNLAFVLTMIVYATGASTEILATDGTLYAEISREMFRTGNYLNIISKGKDWLDKPHFHFWVTALSFKIFGVNQYGYKIPGIISVLIAALFTYRYGKKFYSEKHGTIAAMMLLTAQHIITSNMDVRAEPYMTLFTIMGLYYAALFLDSRRWGYLVLTSFALAILMMIKGLFTIIPIAAAIGCSLWYEKKWKQIFHWQWLVCGMLTLGFMMPSLYGYYQQFDMHPEKWVFGKQDVSAIRFFFIDSQWGRFVNSGPIKGNGDPFFFVHTLLWAFLPWAWIAYYALFQKTKQLIRREITGETYTYFGFIVMFLIFSASKFQLAHYLNPVFPLLAIISAGAIISASEKILSALKKMQVATFFILLLVFSAILYFFQNQLPNISSLLIILIGITGSIVILFNKHFPSLTKVLFVPLFFSLSINYYLNRDFYPELSKYQSESVVADYMMKEKLPADQLVCLGVYENSTSFKLDRSIPLYNLEEAKADQLNSKYVFTNDMGLKKIDSLHISVKLLRTFDDFHTSMLTTEFLNKSTRASTLGKTYLVKLGNE